MTYQFKTTYLLSDEDVSVLKRAAEIVGKLDDFMHDQNLNESELALGCPLKDIYYGLFFVAKRGTSDSQYVWNFETSE